MPATARAATAFSIHACGRVLARAFGAFAAFTAFAMVSVSWAQAQTAPAAPNPGAASAPAYKMRVVGGLGALSQYTRWEEPFWSRELSRLSGGKFSAEITPFDRAGVPGNDMLRLLQLGVVPFGTTLMSSLTAQYPQYTAPDLAGLNPDIVSLRQSLAAFRPYLEKSLRDQQGVEVLAIYTYPAQVLFCKSPVTGLADLKGLRIRVSSAGQSDFVGALGGIAVNTPFAQIVPSFKANGIDCAITGTMAGNTLELPSMTTHLYPMPLTWGLAIFAANRTAWEGLPSELRALLTRELPKLEAAVWEESARETQTGIACNTGAAGCANGKPGSMKLIAISPQDARRSTEIFQSTVLPRWLQRCGPPCAGIWEQTIGPARAIPLP